MIQNNTRKTRAVALLTGGVLASTMVFQPAPAKAADPSKEQLYKGGAAALGVLGAYFILKGKTIPGAIAGAGAYYAYKKGKDVDGERYRDDEYYRNDDYRNDGYRNGDDRYDRRSSRRSDSRNDYYYRNDDYRNDDYDRSDDYYNNDYRRDNRNANTSYPEYYDYSRVAPTQNNHSGAVVLK